jgi:hypothetical protein
MSLDIMIADDAIAEEHETLTVTLFDPVNAALGSPSVATLTILDDDPPPPTPTLQFEYSAYSVGESAAMVSLTVTLSEASDNEVTVQYKTDDGTATAPDDYASSTGMITFPPGETIMSLDIMIADDAIAEEHETLTVTLFDPGNATLGSPSVATLTIMDDDPPVPTVQFETATFHFSESSEVALITVILSEPVFDKEVTVNYNTVDGTANGAQGLRIDERHSHVSRWEGQWGR